MNDYDGNPISKFEAPPSNVVPFPWPPLQAHVQWNWRKAVGFTGSVLGGGFLWWMLLRVTGIL